MSLIMWAALGLVAGLIAGKASHASNSGMHIIVGIVGAIVGGWLFFGHTGAGVNIFSLFFAVIGSIVALAIYHAVAKPRKII